MYAQKAVKASSSLPALCCWSTEITAPSADPLERTPVITRQSSAIEATKAPM